MNELMHYGVLGMKWGVRKDAKKAYKKASEKLDRIEKKTNKYADKVSKRVRTYNDSRYGFSLRKPGAEKYKLRRAQYKYEKQIRKGARWFSHMEKTFSSTDVKLSKAQIDKGKAFATKLQERNQEAVNRVY